MSDPKFGEPCAKCKGPHMTGEELDLATTAIRAKGQASAITLQIALGIGYRHAVALLDRLTADGILGPDTPNGRRELVECRHLGVFRGERCLKCGARIQ